jgi:CRP-like cAMP-binding protein
LGSQKRPKINKQRVPLATIAERSSHASVTWITDNSSCARETASQFVELNIMRAPATRLSRDLYRELKNLATPIFAATGRVLFREGQAPEGAFLIRSGRVRLSLDHTPQYPVRSLGARSAIGLPSTFSGEPYSLTAEAECDSHLDFIPRPKLLELLRSNPEVGFQIVRMLSEEIFQIRKAARALPQRRKRSRKRKT